MSELPVHVPVGEFHSALIETSHGHLTDPYTGIHYLQGYVQVEQHPKLEIEQMPLYVLSVLGVPEKFMCDRLAIPYNSLDVRQQDIIGRMGATSLAHAAAIGYKDKSFRVQDQASGFTRPLTPKQLSRLRAIADGRSVSDLVSNEHKKRTQIIGDLRHARTRARLPHEASLVFALYVTGDLTSSDSY